MKERTKDILVALVSKAIGLGADGIEVEYRDRHEQVTAIKGRMGVGIASLASDSKEAVRLRGQLGGLRKKRKRVEIEGVSYMLEASVFDSFGEMAFHVAIQRAPGVGV